VRVEERSKFPSSEIEEVHGSLVAPMPGKVQSVGVRVGERVRKGQTLVVLEAMKMEQPLNAHKSGTITGLTAEVGATVTAGAAICEIKD
jgi:acetyl-CoA/propionyl-CoA carboxylase biotin carboxyl carrier protein